MISLFFLMPVEQDGEQFMKIRKLRVSGRYQKSPYTLIV